MQHHVQHSVKPQLQSNYSMTPISFTQISRHQFVVHAHGREFSFTSQQDAERFLAGIPLII